MRRILYFLVCTLVSCSAEHTIKNGESALDEGAKPVEITLKPNYQSLRENLFKTQCLGCHDDLGIFSKYDFSTYESTLGYPQLFEINPQEADVRFVKSLVTGAMPKGKPRLSDEQIQVVREWVQLGLPKEALNFETIKKQVLEPHCFRCHDSFMKLPLATYEQVVPYLSKIRWTVMTNQMPPKTPLNDDLKQKLFEWIDQGAAEF
jgi:hypothetical protein